MSIIAIENISNHPVTFIEKNEQMWIIANELAEAIEYKNPRQATYDIINRNFSDFQGYTCVSNLLIQCQYCISKLLNSEYLMRPQFGDA